MGLFRILTEQSDCDICGKSGNKALMQTLVDGRICNDCFNKLGKGKYTTRYTVAEAKQRIDNLHFDIKKIGNPEFKTTLANARKLKTDLLEADYPSPTDEKTAIYRGRIYSISGQDTRFPKLPKDIFNTEISFYPFVYGASEPLYCKPGKEIQFSNRPFEDDRSSNEKAEYDNLLKKHIENEKNKKDYEWVCKYLPEIAPKSLSGYVKMKNSNSANYKKLVESAKQKGYTV